MTTPAVGKQPGLRGKYISWHEMSQNSPRLTSADLRAHLAAGGLDNFSPQMGSEQ